MLASGLMDQQKSDIIRDFMSRGKLLTPDALDMLMKGRHGVETQDLLITSNDIATHEKNFSVIKNIGAKKKDLTTDDFTRFYRSKYEKIRNIITAKSVKSFVSLNKAPSYRDEIHTIGMVRGIKESEGKSVVELEDTTGALPVIFEKADTEGLEVDDVVAVRAISSQNVLFGKQIIFPDVPLRKPSTGIGKGCFVANLNIDEAAKSDVENFFAWTESQDFRFLFVAGNIADAAKFEEYAERYCTGKAVFVIPGEKDSTEGYPQSPIKFKSENIVSLSNPAMVEAGGLKILLTHNFNMDFLKKRYTGRTSEIFDEDMLVLEAVPDVVCFGHSRDPQIMNYKSITIVSSGSIMANFQPIVIDFATREASKINLNLS